MASRRLRVASTQYWIRPIRGFDEFADQVRSLAETAEDYRARLLVFPEYFTTQLLTLGDVKRPIRDQVRDLAGHGDRYRELMAEVARECGMYVVGGTIPVLDGESGEVRNCAHVFSPKGSWAVQGKLHMTRFESEEWFVRPSKGLKVIETDFGRMAVSICYDVEFPELARAAAREGADLLVVPSCTDDRQGFLRVRYCAQARAIENQLFVVQSSTVGSLPRVPAVSLNYGQASILTPSDFAFSRDGILAEGVANQESMVLGDLDLDLLREAREKGTVLPLRDSQNTGEVAKDMETVTL
jgi:predicted amidohydrolase